MAQTLDDRPVLLVVEGKEDVAFFGAIIKYLSLTNIQVKDIGGKTQLPTRLEEVSKQREFLDNIVVLGIIHDADNSSQSAFQSVSSALNKAGLPVPKKQLQVTSGAPRVSVMIVPNGKSSGILEDVCLASITDEKVIVCVDQYFECVPDKHKTHVLSKAQLQVYLAAKEPELRLGEAAEKGFWDWNHPAFDPIKDFLRQISGLAEG